MGRAILASKFMVVETLFNPILSDYFGVNEKWRSYLFFGLIMPAIVGSFAVYVNLFVLLYKFMYSTMSNIGMQPPSVYVVRLTFHDFCKYRIDYTQE